MRVSVENRGGVLKGNSTNLIWCEHSMYDYIFISKILKRTHNTNKKPYYGVRQIIVMHIRNNRSEKNNLNVYFKFCNF